MEREQLGAPAPRRDESPRASSGGEPSLGELLGRLTADTGDLVRAEVALAGALALTAFLIVALGAALDNYWLAALLVGVVLLAVGGIMARSAIADVKRRGVMPAQTLGTLREDAAWAKKEAAAVKRELTQ